MLVLARNIIGSKVTAARGRLGVVEDSHFHDDMWRLRHLVVKDRRFLPKNRSLVQQEEIRDFDQSWGRPQISVELSSDKSHQYTRADRPVSKQAKLQLNHLTSQKYSMREIVQVLGGDPYLRSVREVRGYGCVAKDGIAGYLYDIVFEASTWNVEYLLITLDDMWGFRKRLVPSSQCAEISWLKEEILLKAERKEIWSADKWDDIARERNGEH